MPIFDTHTHYDDEQFNEDRDALIRSLPEHGIGTIMNVCASVRSLDRIVPMTRQYEIAPDRVAALGFSAGGHLCGTLGTLFDSPEVADLGSPEQLRPDALGLCYPVAVSWGRTHEGSFDNLTGGDAALRQRLSLDRLVRPDMPPAFLWHTRNDNSVPCRNSLILAQAMEEAGVDFSLHIYREGKHGLSTANAMAYPTDDFPRISWDVPGWLEACVRFFEEIGLTITDKR